MNMRKIGVAIAALLLSAGAALAANVPLLTGPIDPSSMQNTLNTIIQQFNAATLASPWLPRNLLRGGNFGTNPFQRGTSQAADITNTTTYGPDGFGFLGGASSAIDWSQQTGAADIIPGFGGSLRFQRKASNANTAAVCVGQALETQDSIRAQGQQLTFSFYALPGANWSPASGNLQATLIYGTSADDTLANMFAGSWTTQANAVQSNVAIPVGTAWARYSVTGSVPATATQIGVKLCFTPVGTAGANDWIEMTGLQLEVGPTATVFEARSSQEELRTAQRYFYRITEAASAYYAAGMATATNVETAVLPLPVTMRAIPTCTFTNGGLKWDLNGTDTSVGTLTCAATSTPSIVTIADTTTATVGWTAFLFGSTTTGRINVSAEL